MNKKELKEKAVYQARLRLCNNIFSDIVHYFDKNMLEIGHVIYPETAFESIVVFNSKRIWGKEILDDHEIIKINQRGTK